LINKNAFWQRNYLYPFAIAVAFPGIRFMLNWFNAFMRVKERSQILQTSGTGKMSTLRFLELKKSYDDRIAAISKYIDQEAALQVELNSRNTEIITLKGQLETKISSYDQMFLNLTSNFSKLNEDFIMQEKNLLSSNKSLEFFNLRKNISFLKGNYNVEFWSSSKNSLSTFIKEINVEIKINDNQYYIICFKDNFNEHEYISNITDYVYDFGKNSILVKLELENDVNMRSDADRSFYSLFDKELKLYENGVTLIGYLNDDKKNLRLELKRL